MRPAIGASSLGSFAQDRANPRAEAAGKHQDIVLFRQLFETKVTQQMFPDYLPATTIVAGAPWAVPTAMVVCVRYLKGGRRLVGPSNNSPRRQASVTKEIGAKPRAVLRSTLAARVPAHHGVGNGIGRGKIRLDVDERRIVQAVDASDIKRVALDA